MNDFAVDHHLSRCANEAGMFVVLAIDHRDNLVDDMSEARGRRVAARDVIAFKRSAIRHLAGTSSAVLIDPGYGFPALVESGLAARFGLLAPLEVTDYSLHPSRRKTVFIEDWDVDKVKRSGCSGVKLLLYFHPDAETAGSQTDLVDAIVERCAAHAIPFFLEPIVYSLDPAKPLTNEERSQAVVATAAHFSHRGVDVLKLQFPLNPDADESRWEPILERLNEACTVPWTLLSAGVSFDLFLRQAAAACRAGASGVMVGRAVWAEGMQHEGAELDRFMRTTGRARMAALGKICDLYGRAWSQRTGRPEMDETWYRTRELSAGA